DPTTRGGVYRSTDGGATWLRVTDTSADPTRAVSGLPPGNVTDLKAVRDPANPANNAILFAASTGNASFAGAGIYMSTNQGLTWTPASLSIPTNLPSITGGTYNVAANKPKRIELAVQALDKGTNSATNVYAGVITDTTGQ